MKDENDKQTTDVFESPAPEKPVKKGAGGYRPGAGRPKGSNCPSVNMRVPTPLVDSFKVMIKGFKAGHSFEFRIISTDSEDS